MKRVSWATSRPEADGGLGLKVVGSKLPAANQPSQLTALLIATVHLRFVDKVEIWKRRKEVKPAQSTSECAERWSSNRCNKWPVISPYSVFLGFCNLLSSKLSTTRSEVYVAILSNSKPLLLGPLFFNYLQANSSNVAYSNVSCLCCPAT